MTRTPQPTCPTRSWGQDWGHWVVLEEAEDDDYNDDVPVTVDETDNDVEVDDLA